MKMRKFEFVGIDESSGTAQVPYYRATFDAVEVEFGGYGLDFDSAAKHARRALKNISARASACSIEQALEGEVEQATGYACHATTIA